MKISLKSLWFFFTQMHEKDRKRVWFFSYLSIYLKYEKYHEHLFSLQNYPFQVYWYLSYWQMTSSCCFCFFFKLNMTSQSFQIDRVQLRTCITKRGIFLNIKIQQLSAFLMKFRGFCLLFVHALITISSIINLFLLKSVSLFLKIIK